MGLGLDVGLGVARHRPTAKHLLPEGKQLRALGLEADRGHGASITEAPANYAWRVCLDARRLQRRQQPSVLEAGYVKPVEE